jgi:hypothetical protein
MKDSNRMHETRSELSLPHDATRREFFSQCGLSIGALGLASLLGRDVAAAAPREDTTNPLAPSPPHFAAKAKSVIYLFMAGGPSQLELFEDKPKLRELSGHETLLGPQQTFGRYGQSGAVLSDLCRTTARSSTTCAFLRE